VLKNPGFNTTQNSHPRMAKKRKWYGVRLGYKVGIFETWDECKLQVDGFKGAVFKAFDSQQEALAFVNSNKSALQPNGFQSPPEASAVGCSSVLSPALPKQSTRALLSVKKRGNDAEVSPSHDSETSTQASKAPRLIEGIGMRVLEQCGWKGGGLGAQENGILNPINPIVLPGKRSGIGSIDCSTALTIEDIASSSSRCPLPPQPRHLPPPQDLSRDQLRFIELAQSGCNIFLTGLGGTGKSHVLKLVVKMLRLKWGDGNVKAGRSAVVLASSTGVSSVSIGGVTLHSIAGCGVPRYAVHFDRMWSRKKFWRGVRVRLGCSWWHVQVHASICRFLFLMKFP
jgi:hypothetical protein